MDTQSTCNRGDHQISHLDRTLLIVRIYSHILDSTLDALMFASWVLSQLIMLYQQVVSVWEAGVLGLMYCGGIYMAKF